METGYCQFELPDFVRNSLPGQVSPNEGDVDLIRDSRGKCIWTQNTDTGERAVVKMYHSRNLWDWYRGKAFRFRVQREYDSLAFLHSSGVACSEPLFWSFGQCPGFGRYEILSARMIPDATPLDIHVESLGVGIGHFDFMPLYKMVRLMHEKGFYHGGLLCLRNILVSKDMAGQMNLSLIDTPRSMMFPNSIVGTRMAWFDLLDVSHTVKHLCSADGFRLLLKGYGLSESEADRFSRCSARYLPDRHTRNRLRGEFTARESLAWVMAGCRLERN